MKEKEKMDSIEKLQKKFEEVYILKDTGIIKMLMASIIGTQIGDIPIWLMFVAPSGGGKTELINSLEDIKFPTGKKMIHFISELTPNTFISGMQRTGEETSFLHSIPPIGSILVFKDFTSMLSLTKEDQAKIFGQLREIYDGKYVKRTGNGGGEERHTWRGKLGAIAASTEVIYQNAGKLSSSMGDRFIMYQVEQPDRKEAARRTMRNKHKINSMRKMVRDAVSEYMGYLFENFQDLKEALDKHRDNDKIIDALIDVADLSSKVRSGVFLDFKEQNVTFVPSQEMPTRIIEQLSTIGDALFIMGKLKPENIDNEDYQLEEGDLEFLFKIAFSSIPIKRKMALIALAQYKRGVSTGGVGNLTGYKTDVVGQWLTELMGLGVVTRRMQTGMGYIWKIRKEYEEIILKYQNITQKDELYHTEDFENDFDDGAKYGEIDWGGF